MKRPRTILSYLLACPPTVSQHHTPDLLYPHGAWWVIISIDGSNNRLLLYREHRVNNVSFGNGQQLDQELTSRHFETPFVNDLRSYLAFDPARFPILQLQRGHHARFYKCRIRSNLVNCTCSGVYLGVSPKRHSLSYTSAVKDGKRST